MYRPDLDNRKELFYELALPDEWAFFENDTLIRIRLPFDMGNKRQYGRGYQEIHVDPARPFEHLHLVTFFTWNGSKDKPTIEECIHYSQWEGYLIDGIVIDSESAMDPYKGLPANERPKYYGQFDNGASSYLRREGKKLDW